MSIEERDSLVVEGKEENEYQVRLDFRLLMLFSFLFDSCMLQRWGNEGFEPWFSLLSYKALGQIFFLVK